MTTTAPRTWTYETIALEALTAIDLRAVISITDGAGAERLMSGDEMASRGIDAEAYRIHVEGSATPATAVVRCHRDWATIGLEWGAGAVWADLPSLATDDDRWLETPGAAEVIEAAIETWLNGDIGWHQP